MKDNIREFLTKYNEKEGFETDTGSLLETLFEADEVHSEPDIESRWWTVYSIVVKINDKYLYFVNAVSTGDESASDLGYKFNDDEICFVEPFETKVIRYKEIKDES